MSIDSSLPVVSGDALEFESILEGERQQSSACGCASEQDTAPQEVPEWFNESGATFGTELKHLEWIDEFVENVRPYVRVRPEDGVLIKMPQEAFQLNRSGLLMLKRTLDGEPIRRIAESLGAAQNSERIYQIHTFFCDVRDLLSGRLGDGTGRKGTETSRFDGGFTRYPVLSEIAVTYKCNQACTFCYAGCGTSDATPGNENAEKHRNWWKIWRHMSWWKNRNQKRDPVAKEMTTAEVIKAIDQIGDIGKVPSISFTGGECTLRKDLPEFIHHARHVRGMRVNIITNGLTCSSKKYTDKLVKAGLTSAQISIEGPTPEIHDALTQHPGAFVKAVKGIINLRDAGIHVHSNTTICEENADHLAGIIDLSKELRLPHVSMNHIIPTGTPNLARHEQIKVSYTKIGDYVMHAKRHADNIGIDFHWYSPTPFCIFNPVAHGLGNKGCAACDGIVHVSPAGEVLPCSSFARGVGNILDKGFDDVWFGKDAQYYKNKRQAHPICHGCEHFELCQGACTLYWSGMGYAELYQANTKRLKGTIANAMGRN